jgi:hypothetical protein
VPKACEGILVNDTQRKLLKPSAMLDISPGVHWYYVRIETQVDFNSSQDNHNHGEADHRTGEPLQPSGGR